METWRWYFFGRGASLLIVIISIITFLFKNYTEAIWFMLVGIFILLYELGEKLI